MHKHHVIPKHMGGSNDSSNIVELTAVNHAEAHRVLFEKYGHWEDKLAWKALSGQISHDQAIREASSRANKGQSRSLGKHWKLSEQSKINISEGHKGVKNHNYGKHIAPHKGFKHSDTAKKLIGKSRKGKHLARCSCVICKKETTILTLHSKHIH